MAYVINVNHIQFMESLVVVPDAVHLAKTYKCSWANWLLVLGERHRRTGTFGLGGR